MEFPPPKGILLFFSFQKTSFSFYVFKKRWLYSISIKLQKNVAYIFKHIFSSIYMNTINNFLEKITTTTFFHHQEKVHMNLG